MLLAVLLAFLSAASGACLVQPDSNGRVIIDGPRLGCGSEDIYCRVPSEAFMDCVLLKEMVIVNVTHIDYAAFQGCTNLVRSEQASHFLFEVC